MIKKISLMFVSFVLFLNYSSAIVADKPNFFIFYWPLFILYCIVAIVNAFRYKNEKSIIYIFLISIPMAILILFIMIAILFILVNIGI